MAALTFPLQPLPSAFRQAGGDTQPAKPGDGGEEDRADVFDVSLDYAGQIAAQGQSHGISARVGGEF